MKEEYYILGLLDEAADLIAEGHFMNVSYCESMDMDLLPQVVNLLLGHDSEVHLDDLQFLAWNNNLFPESLQQGTLEEFRAYANEHKDEILKDIQRTCEDYIEEYSEYVDADDNDDDEPTYLDGRTWDELSEHDKGVVADLEM